MSEVATIHVERVFPGRKAGKGEVYDVRTVDGSKYAAWGAVGEALHSLGNGVVDVEYELRPKNGYDNATILSFKEGSSHKPDNGATPSPAPKGEYVDPKGHQINRSVAFKGAVDVWKTLVEQDILETAGGLDSIAAIAELTQGLLDVVEGTYTVSDGFSLEDTE